MRFVIFVLFGIFNLAFGQTCPEDEPGLHLWSDVSIWGGELPGTGDVATVDTSVLLDVTSVTVRQIHVIGSGRLIISDNVGDITITADGILVKDSGSLIIGGSDECRFQNKVHFRLTGSRTTDRSQLDGKGEKFIAVEDSGSLLIYGQEKRGWTRLTETVERWPVSGDNVLYSHATSQFHFDTDRWNEGPAMYIFYECNEQPKYYRVFDFDQNGNTANEQNVVNQMITALDGVLENEIVAIATQRRFKTTADLTNLYTKLEMMSGIPRIALRNSQELDPYALVFQRGGQANEAFKLMIGTNLQEARASIVVNDKKVTAVSHIRAWDSGKSVIDFRILSQSVGYPTLSVADDINTWQIGDEVIVTTTDYNMWHTEVRTIKEIVDSHTLRLSDELDYRHFGNIEDGVDMRAEVGLLTRNIKIQGVMARGCPPNNENCDEFEYHDTYGAHVKIFGFTTAHIEGVELTNVGQAFDNGFYPVHFHMCQDISDREAVIKSNSFHNTYARATTIHGTWGQNETHTGVQILGNVAYDIIGHCYFTEDGAEKYTVFDGNLGARIKNIETNGFETDRTEPTVFWLTNPKIKVTNNAAAGSKGTGYWYVFPEAPVGPSTGMAYQPGEAKNTPIWLFDNNVAHSVERDGFRFDDNLIDDRGKVDGNLNYQPRTDPFDETSEIVKTQISRLTCYKNFRRNTWLRAGWFELMQYSSAESRRGLQSASSNRYRTYVKKSIFVGRSRDNSEEDGYPDAPDLEHYFGIIHYDGPIFIDQIWFNGFKTTEEYIGGALGFQPHKTFNEAFSSNATDIRFGFVDKADGTGGNRILDGMTLSHTDGTFGLRDPVDRTASFRNIDSSILQCPGEEPSRQQLLMPYSYIAKDDCVIRNNWQAVACDNIYGTVHVGADGRGVRMDMIQVKRMNRLDSNDVAYEDHELQPSNVFTTALGSTKYYYLFQYIEDFPRIATLHALGIERGAPVVIGICLPEGISISQMKLWARRPPSVSTPNDGWIIVDTLDEVFADDTMTRVYVDGRTAYIRYVSSLDRDLHWDQLDDDHCPGRQCPIFSATVASEVTDFVYTPCFTVPPEEQNKTMTDATMNSMTCDLPASSPDADWGAGDASREVIQGGWSEWSSWSECCGDEMTTRRRLCDNPLPKGGADCPGDATETVQCPIECAVDGELNDWTRWSECFCDGIAAGSSGAATRTRQCTVEHDGEFCWGALTEHKPCYGGCQ